MPRLALSAVLLLAAAPGVTAQDFAPIDDRATHYIPRSPAADRMLEQAADHERAEDWEAAAALYASLLEQDGRLLCADDPPTCPRRFIPLAEAVALRLARWPPAALADALRTAEDRAAALWTHLRLTTRDPQRLAVLATRYALTPAGAAAAERMGALALERGRPVEALAWWRA
ncbi:MAG: hypothetical protein HZA54_02090, partial [Planctomycetes bacterium]|nr:hypothetical protein [Planctomycetota bacterium]